MLCDVHRFHDVLYIARRDMRDMRVVVVCVFLIEVLAILLGLSLDMLMHNKEPTPSRRGCAATLDDGVGNMTSLLSTHSRALLTAAARAPVSLIDFAF